MSTHLFPISEIFYSIQGEGTLTGVPSVFVRLSYCNLRCIWCDTPYTSWHPEAEQMTLGQITEQVAQHHCRHVVITGGEPFIYPNLPLLCEAFSDYHTTVETNATRYLQTSVDLISMSPKLANSTPAGRWAVRHERMRLQPDVIRLFLQHHKCQVKFVVDTADDIEEIRTLVERIPIPPERVVLMPQARAPSEQYRQHGWIVEQCLREGYRYSTRLHIELWGNERGK